MVVLVCLKVNGCQTQPVVKLNDFSSNVIQKSKICSKEAKVM